ncbi:hypothetical protein T03_14997 [Trichinella britovi]|uniref:Uncharacterized protein n=1 Tax=Trichinella britovi TaxID=45882 RepID=A0A0V1CIP8_TRIBR|nr:hypothetical protein T03_14997 [Trichinella britovi]
MNRCFGSQFHSRTRLNYRARKMSKKKLVEISGEEEEENKKLRTLTIHASIGRRTSNVKAAILVDKNSQFFGNALQFDHNMSQIFEMTTTTNIFPRGRNSFERRTISVSCN